MVPALTIQRIHSCIRDRDNFLFEINFLSWVNIAHDIRSPHYFHSIDLLSLPATVVLFLVVTWRCINPRESSAVMPRQVSEHTMETKDPLRSINGCQFMKCSPEFLFSGILLRYFFYMGIGSEFRTDSPESIWMHAKTQHWRYEVHRRALDPIYHEYDKGVLPCFQKRLHLNC
jgi:hypothetical protein